MEWERLLSTKRHREMSGKGKHPADLRTEFEKDYHRIIGSASFRRLQDKTQVFPLDQSDFIRTRLTHSLEVSSFAKSLGQNIGANIIANKKDSGFTPQMKEDIGNILQCAGLIHDIGNPPFGHFGETAIREWFERNLTVLKLGGRTLADMLTPQMREDFYHFEGNAQALRLVSKLHFLVDEHGMNLTYALLNTIVKYPVASTEIDQASGNIKDKKLGYYFADREIFEDIQRETGTDGRRHPLTFILEAADDIAYKTADIEDAVIKKYLSYRKLMEELERLDAVNADSTFGTAEKLRQKYERGVRNHVPVPEKYAVKNWIVYVQGFLIGCATRGFMSNYEAIMDGTYRYDLFHGTFAESLMKVLGDIANSQVFMSDSIYKMEVAENVIIDFLLSRFVKAAVKYDTDEKMDSIDRRMISLISDNYKNAYVYHARGKAESEKLYLRLMLVTDYICGMTDSYAKRLYQEMNGII